MEIKARGRGLKGNGLRTVKLKPTSRFEKFIYFFTPTKTSKRGTRYKENFLAVYLLADPKKSNEEKKRRE